MAVKPLLLSLFPTEHGIEQHERRARQRSADDVRQPVYARKLMDALHDLVIKIKRALNGGEVRLSDNQRAAFRELADKVGEMEQLFSEALETTQGKAGSKNAANEGGKVRYSLNPEFSDRFDAWLRADKKNDPASGRFLVGTTSDSLQSIGVSDYKIYWNAAKIAKIMNEHPAMTADVIKSVPNILEHPILVMQSQTVANRITMFGEVMDEAGNPVLAALELSPQNKAGEIQDFAVIASAYGKSGAQRLIDQSDILYIDPNKKRTDSWLQLLRLQLPSRVTDYGSIGSVTLVPRDVNGNLSFGKGGEKTAMQIAFEKAANQNEHEERIRTTKYSLKTDSEGRRLTDAQEEYFKNSKVRDAEGRLKPVYHGTSRADRVGNVFRPERATSGPMAFFTDNADIAQNYSRDKSDTSISYDTDYDSYETQFRTAKDGKSISLIDVWRQLP